MNNSINCVTYARRLFDFLTWIMMIVTFVISIFTTIVVFGIAWSNWLSRFSNFMPLEISLAITFFLWGTTSIISLSDKKGKTHGIFSFLFGGVLLVFLILEVY
ncbi:hypothetical protein [Clostridium cylindrosporum]|uniref:Uncharacterized protein n=1 Tax=Clostridium cylindrosporum DSM 605 TaxID=1121307 RepID=A0A0J8G6P1_CLOCY|nr:hypothetical protein [Clostridium cylindrosporum]KMT23271.1 hypothetical protein CLCY_8c00070 [Clostridium cylindrosporum DSM 605]